MFCHSVLKRWDTPIAGASSVAVESIEADGYLSITLKATVNERVLLICFSFLNYQWYQLKRFAPNYNASAGRTQIHENAKEPESNNSSLLNLNYFASAMAELNDCYLCTLPVNSSHFVFIEDKSEIEVISTTLPKITLIGKGPLNQSTQVILI